MEDLEVQLGTSRVPYLQIRISYAHSAFPTHSATDTFAGVSGMMSRMETTATAILTHYNTSSPWSIRPVTSPKPLSEIIESHWGTEKAREVMYQIRTQHSSPRNPPEGGPSLSPNANGTYRELSIPPNYILPPVPTRRASLQKLATTRPPRSQEESPKELRQRILSRGNVSRDAARTYQPTYDTNTSRGSRSSNAWQRDTSLSQRSNRSLFTRGSPGAETMGDLRSRSPDFALEDRSSRRPSRRSATVSSKGKRASWKWSWASWF